jgi:hypothetical protein
MDNWKEDRLTEVTSHLYYDLESKEETFKKLEAILQETKQAPFICTTEDSTMKKEKMVNSPSKTLGDFEKHARGIISKIMIQMGYDGQW